jgi:glucose-fructose oxidoreductase
MLDYLGYGVTLGTWFFGGRAPEEVTTILGGDPALEVDEHSLTVARYGQHLSKFETRWGTFTDPWVHQPQPKCGFVIVGTNGTISSYDYEDHVTVQTRTTPAPARVPVDTLPEGRRGPVEYVLSCLGSGRAIEGPLDPGLCRIAQQIVDTARASADQGRRLELIA